MCDKIKCKDGNPSLVDIYSHERAEDTIVVRWCQYCGAIAVDLDYDGRTNPGGWMPMRFSTITEEK